MRLDDLPSALNSQPGTRFSEPPAVDDLIIKEAKRRHRRRMALVGAVAAVVVSLIGFGIANIQGSSPPRSHARTVASTAPPSITPAASSPCVPNQLALVFRGGGLSTGNDFGSIIVRNVGGSACSLSGAVTVNALDAEKVPIVGATGMGSFTLNTGINMTPDTALWPKGQPLPSGAFEITVGGDERDNPTTGLSCTPGQEVYPTYWQVQIAESTLDVVNNDPDAFPGGPGSVPRVDGCLGNFLNLAALNGY